MTKHQLTELRKNAEKAVRSAKKYEETAAGKRYLRRLAIEAKRLRKRKPIMIDTEEKLLKYKGKPQTKAERDRLVGLLMHNQRTFLRRVSKMSPAEAKKAIDKAGDPDGLTGKRFWTRPLIRWDRLFPVQEMPSPNIAAYYKRLKKRGKKHV